MTIFRLELSSKNQAVLTVNVQGERGWIKRKLVAASAESLWTAIHALRDTEFLSPARREELVSCLTKAEEREQIEIALERFLNSGGTIRRVQGTKTILSERDKQAVLEVLADLDLEPELKTAGGAL